MFLIRRHDTGECSWIGGDAELKDVQEIAKRHFGHSAEVFEFRDEHYHEIAQDVHAAMRRIRGARLKRVDDRKRRWRLR